MPRYLDPKTDKVAIVKKLLSEGDLLERVAALTDLSIDEILQIQNE